MVKKIINILGSLCILLLLVFSIIELIKNAGSWTSIDYIWLAAIILFVIGFVGDFILSKRAKDHESQESL